MRIISNHQHRDLITFFDLTPKEQEEAQETYGEEEGQELSYFRYRGNVYSLADFYTTQNIPALRGWHWMAGQSAFHGILIKEVDGGDTVVIGSYVS
jgi:hypothetical protein